jgi:hypothetical protein
MIENKLEQPAQPAEKKPGAGRETYNKYHCVKLERA